MIDPKYKDQFKLPAQFFNEFKEFAIRGNVLGLAIGVIIGSAFGRVVSAAVNDILMPFLGLFLGAVDLSTLSFSIGNATFKYGHFIQSVVDFIIIAASIFLIIKALNFIIKMEVKKEDPLLKAAQKQISILEEINNLIKKSS